MHVSTASLLDLANQLMARKQAISAKKQTERDPNERLCMTVEETVLCNVVTQLLDLAKGSLDVPA